MNERVGLEPKAHAVSCENMDVPHIYQMPPQMGRKILEKAQASPVFMHSVQIETRTVWAGSWGKVPVYTLIPKGCKKNADILYYIHGAGWVFGSFHTHEKLVRELAARTGCIVVFPEYSRSPEARYPVAIEQCYT